MPDVTVFTSGLHFPESPRWHDGHLWLSDITGRAIHRYTPPSPLGAYRWMARPVMSDSHRWPSCQRGDSGKCRPLANTVTSDNSGTSEWMDQPGSGPAGSARPRYRRVTA